MTKSFTTATYSGKPAFPVPLFDAVERAKKEGREILSVSEAPEDELDDEYVFD
jgi:hypothetical protein